MDYMNRPARKQASGPKGMKQGSGTYNVWYDRWTGEDYKKGGVDKAITRCAIARDAGRTKGNWNTASRFCLYFARGCCDKGEECTYLHRIPFESDIEDTAFDCFGRERFRLHRDDMGGVGSLEKDSKTLYVGRLSTSRNITDALKRHFTEWGELDHLRVFPEKCIAFVRYKKRSNAEFAKEAMYGQSLDNKEVLNVRWAEDDPNPRAIAENQEKAEEQFYEATRAKMPQLGEKGDVFAYEGYYENPENWQQNNSTLQQQEQQQYQTPEEYYAAYATWYAQHGQAVGSGSGSTEDVDANSNKTIEQPLPPIDPSLNEKSQEYQAAYWNWYYYMMNAYGGAPPPPGTNVLALEENNSLTEINPTKKIKTDVVDGSSSQKRDKSVCGNDEDKEVGEEKDDTITIEKNINSQTTSSKRKAENSPPADLSSDKEQS